jgi:hypothetical protein
MTGCNPPERVTPPTLDADVMVAPGAVVQLRVPLVAAGTVTWRMVEPNGGTVDQNGLYRAPPCATFQEGVYHVEALQGNKVVGSVAIGLKDKIVDVTIICALVAGETSCRDPNLPIEVEPGTQIQFIAKVDYVCRTDFTADLP